MWEGEIEAGAAVTGSPGPPGDSRSTARSCSGAPSSRRPGASRWPPPSVSCGLAERHTLGQSPTRKAGLSRGSGAGPTWPGPGPGWRALGSLLLGFRNALSGDGWIHSEARAWGPSPPLSAIMVPSRLSVVVQRTSKPRQQGPPWDSRCSMELSGEGLVGPPPVPRVWDISPEAPPALRLQKIPGKINGPHLVIGRPAGGPAPLPVLGETLGTFPSCSEAAAAFPDSWTACGWLGPSLMPAEGASR